MQETLSSGGNAEHSLQTPCKLLEQVIRRVAQATFEAY